MTQQLIDDLLEVRNIIEKRGLITGKFENMSGQLCLDGALRTVIFGSIALPTEGPLWLRYIDAYHAIVDSAPSFPIVPIGHLQYLNDHLAKGDKDIVFRWIDKALAKASQSEFAGAR